MRLKQTILWTVSDLRNTNDLKGFLVARNLKSYNFRFIKELRYIQDKENKTLVGIELSCSSVNKRKSSICMSARVIT